ncbi:MAG: dTDP-4-dehydrorhamnose 3,5-epimerase family protein [Gemmataceae bacterium]
MFHEGPIDGILCQPLKTFHDPRGWLCELFRDDEVPPEFRPVMGYVSETLPGVARGPHEHVDQADYFCFLGPSDFKIYLWDNRPKSPTYRRAQTILGGETNPLRLIIPAGVVHAYRNVGSKPGIVINCPNRLYRGQGKKEPVDEIRHEDDPASVFQLD